MIVSSSASRAFDSIASTYDEVFTYSVIGRAQRNAVWRVLSSHLHQGDHVLDMNCGTGEDALFMSSLGANVIAFDSSHEMLTVAQEKALNAGLEATFLYLSIEAVDQIDFTNFDFVLSNFSGMNCVEDLSCAAQKISRLMTHGQFALVVSTRYCLWEIFHFVAKGDWNRATRRWNGFAEPRVGEHKVHVWYPTVRELQRAMSPYFEIDEIRAVGLTVPPSYMEHWARKHTKMIRALERVDEYTCKMPLLRVLGDHVLLLFRSTEHER